MTLKKDLEELTKAMIELKAAFYNIVSSFIGADSSLGDLSLVETEQGHDLSMHSDKINQS